MHATWRIAAIGALLCASAAVWAQIPSQGVRSEAQQRTDREAMEYAQKDELALAARIGALNGPAAVTMIRWSRATTTWKNEKHPGAAPHVALGVLMDCLSRIREIKTPFLAGDPTTPFPSDLAGERAKRAVDEFDAALKVDPALIEARLRRARIRAPKDRAAAVELERIADGEAAYPYPYIAAISRAEVALAAHDDASGERWYRRALFLWPGSAAARIGLSTVSPSLSLPLDGAGREDPYYEYPCRILTTDVAGALATRMQAAPKR